MKDLEDGGEGAEGSDEEGGEVGCNRIEENIDGAYVQVGSQGEGNPLPCFKNAWLLGMEIFSLY